MAGKHVSKTHGECVYGKSTEWVSWQSMRERATGRTGDPKIYAHVRCCLWLYSSFPNFLSLLGRKPTRKHSVDRTNNDGHYSCGDCPQCREHGWPLNVRWATRKEQNRNKSNNVLVTWNGKTQCMSAWAEELGMTADQLCHRLTYHKWSIERALTQPLRAPRHRIP